MRVFDYVIAGGGTAGCLIANRLARAGASVCLLEAGGTDRRLVVRVPVGYLYCIGNKETDYLYQLQPEKALHNRVLRYPRGRVLGGCSSINGMIYMRGQREDYESWSALTRDEGWGWDAMLQQFKRHESHWNTGANPTMHGYGGEWRVEPQRLRWDVLDAFADACVEAGVPRTSDFNTGTNEGVAYFEVNQRRGTRWNTRRAFLDPSPAGVEVRTNVLVDRVLWDENGPQLRAAGLLLRDGSQVEARKEVILCAGSIGSPAILERSGVGRGDVLRGAGVKIRIENSHVGEHMCDHLQIRTVFRMGHGVSLNSLYQSPWQRLRMGVEYLINRSGPLSMAPSQLGVFTRSDSSRSRPNIQYHVQPLSLDKFGDPLHSFDAMTISVCNLQPTSRGSTHISSQDASASPVIVANYLSTEEDKRVAIDSLRVTRKLAAQAAMRPFQLTEHAPGSHLVSDAELLDGAGRIGTTIFHPTSTCAMGRVLDSQLCVQGVQRLRVADASAFPHITSGNTCSPVLALAERAAELILKNWAHVKTAA